MIITISEGIRRTIAEKVVEQARSSYRYDVQGEWFVVDGTTVAHKARNAPAAPWDAAAHVIPVDQLASLDGSAVAAGALFNCVECTMRHVPDCYDATQYEAWIA